MEAILNETFELGLPPEYGLSKQKIVDMLRNPIDYIGLNGGITSRNIGLMDDIRLFYSELGGNFGIGLIDALSTAIDVAHDPIIRDLDRFKGEVTALEEKIQAELPPNQSHTFLESNHPYFTRSFSSKNSLSHSLGADGSGSALEQSVDPRPSILPRTRTVSSSPVLDSNITQLESILRENAHHLTFPDEIQYDGEDFIDMLFYPQEYMLRGGSVEESAPFMDNLRLVYIQTEASNREQLIINLSRLSDDITTMDVVDQINEFRRSIPEIELRVQAQYMKQKFNATNLGDLEVDEFKPLQIYREALLDKGLFYRHIPLEQRKGGFSRMSNLAAQGTAEAYTKKPDIPVLETPVDQIEYRIPIGKSWGAKIKDGLYLITQASMPGYGFKGDHAGQTYLTQRRLKTDDVHGNTLVAVAPMTDNLFSHPVTKDEMEMLENRILTVLRNPSTINYHKLIEDDSEEERFVLEIASPTIESPPNLVSQTFLIDIARNFPTFFMAGNRNRYKYGRTITKEINNFLTQYLIGNDVIIEDGHIILNVDYPEAKKIDAALEMALTPIFVYDVETSVIPGKPLNEQQINVGYILDTLQEGIDPVSAVAFSNPNNLDMSHLKERVQEALEERFGELGYNITTIAINDCAQHVEDFRREYNVSLASAFHAASDESSFVKLNGDKVYPGFNNTPATVRGTPFAKTVEYSGGSVVDPWLHVKRSNLSKFVRKMSLSHVVRHNEHNVPMHLDVGYYEFLLASEIMDNIITPNAVESDYIISEEEIQAAIFYAEKVLGDTIAAHQVQRSQRDSRALLAQLTRKNQGTVSSLPYAELEWYVWSDKTNVHRSFKTPSNPKTFASFENGIDIYKEAQMATFVPEEMQFFEEIIKYLPLDKQEASRKMADMSGLTPQQQMLRYEEIKRTILAPVTTLLDSLRRGIKRYAKIPYEELTLEKVLEFVKEDDQGVIKFNKILRGLPFIKDVKQPQSDNKTILKWYSPGEYKKEFTKKYNYVIPRELLRDILNKDLEERIDDSTPIFRDDYTAFVSNSDNHKDYESIKTGKMVTINGIVAQNDKPDRLRSQIVCFRSETSNPDHKGYYVKGMNPYNGNPVWATQFFLGLFDGLIDGEYQLLNSEGAYTTSFDEYLENYVESLWEVDLTSDEDLGQFLIKVKEDKTDDPRDGKTEKQMIAVREKNCRVMDFDKDFSFNVSVDFEIGESYVGDDGSSYTVVSAVPIYQHADPEVTDEPIDYNLTVKVTEMMEISEFRNLPQAARANFSLDEKVYLSKLSRESVLKNLYRPIIEQDDMRKLTIGSRVQGRSSNNGFYYAQALLNKIWVKHNPGEYLFTNENNGEVIRFPHKFNI